MSDVTKAVVLVGGLGTRFLPITKSVSKELLPLVDRPIIHHVMEELRDSGIKEIVFICSPRDTLLQDHLKKDKALLKELIKRDKLEMLDEMQDLVNNFSTSFVVQDEPLGNAHALFQAKRKIKKDPFVLVFPDDLFQTDKPATKQLLDVYRSSKRPIVGLYGLPREEVIAYGVVKKENIAKGLCKIQGMVEKPLVDEAPSNLAVVGRYVLEPFIFDFIEEAMSKEGENGFKETYLTEAIALALDSGKTFYGSEIKGRWLECGTVKQWIQSHILASLNDPRYGVELRKTLKKSL